MLRHIHHAACLPAIDWGKNQDGHHAHLCHIMALVVRQCFLYTFLRAISHAFCIQLCKPVDRPSSGDKYDGRIPVVRLVLSHIVTVFSAGLPTSYSKNLIHTSDGLYCRYSLIPIPTMLSNLLHLPCCKKRHTREWRAFEETHQRHMGYWGKELISQQDQIWYRLCPNAGMGDLWYFPPV